ERAHHRLRLENRRVLGAGELDLLHERALKLRLRLGGRDSQRHSWAARIAVLPGSMPPAILERLQGERRVALEKETTTAPSVIGAPQSSFTWMASAVGHPPGTLDDW